MKYFLLGILSVTLFVLLKNCSSVDVNPQFCIRNERANIANVQIHTSGGNVIKFDDILPGETTVYRSVSEGIVVATVHIDNEFASPSGTFFGRKEKHSTLVIQTGNTPLLRMDQ